MQYVLYGAPGSGSGIVEAACAWIGLELEVRDLDARNEQHREPAFASLNPSRKLPVLVVHDSSESDSSEVLTEVLAILLTLDERYPSAGLLPNRGSEARAQALRWMAFLASEVYPTIEMTDHPERFVGVQNRSGFARRMTSVRRQRWQILEANISGDPYCVRGPLSAVDLYITKLAVWSDDTWRRTSLPKIDAVTRAVLAEPRLAEVWKRHVPTSARK